ncbi:MAG: hypothetical protein M3303_11775 [Gemmatimonadota bacterium]|nr:hypothetical protein [Gemmatimonadota bacterium]
MSLEQPDWSNEGRSGCHRRCVSADATIQSPPEQHYVEDGEDYYAFFAFDPDGIRIEVFCWPSSPYSRA